MKLLFPPYIVLIFFYFTRMLFRNMHIFLNNNVKLNSRKIINLKYRCMFNVQSRFSSLVKSSINKHDESATADLMSETNEAGNVNLTNAKPFELVPGPKPLPLIGTLHNYWPFIGEYRLNLLHKNGEKNFKLYGPLVREKILNTNIIHVFDPIDIEKVFRSEGRFPERRSHLAMRKYRISKPALYNNGGLLTTNGSEWWKLRSTFQKNLSNIRNVKNYAEPIDSIVIDFCERIKKSAVAKPNEVIDFLPELNRLNLELVCMIAFDVRLNSFSAEELLPTSKTSKLIEAAFDTNSSTLKLEQSLQLWRFFDTPLYRKLCASQEYIEKVAIEFILNKLSFVGEMDTQKEPSLLESYLANPQIDLKDVICTSVDLIMAGIDTTSYSTSFALYHLARNPEQQNKLFDESLQILPSADSPITPEVINKASYLKAVLKETLRLNPVSIGIGRVLVNDAELSGYRIPKGTTIVTQNYVACRSEHYFLESLKFQPERWFKNSEKFQQISPFLSLPFGFGPRSCIARRLAEQNMHITLLRLIRNFELSWVGEELDIETLLINKPSKPVKVRFHPRFV